MDMELQHTRLGGYRPVYEALLRQEETLESIVPDALPDIARIVEAAGTVFLRQKETLDGSVRVTGTVRTAVLYLPEDGGAPCCLTLNIPFLCSGDHPSLHSGCQTQVGARVLVADAQMLNPRKVLARVELAVEVSAWAEEQSEVCIQVDCGEDRSVQTLTESRKDLVAVDVAEKSFTFSDVLRLPGSRPPMEQLLSARAELGCAETKVIGKKLVVKGETTLTVLYKGPEGVASARFELPFSQIVEVKAAEDGCFVWAQAALTGMDCSMREAGEMEVSFEVLLQAVVREEREVTLLSDLYSVSQPLEASREKVILRPMAEQGSRRGLARQFCECAVPAKQVVDCRLTVGEIEKAPAGEGGCAITAKTYASVLYISEDDSLCAASFTIPAGCEIPAVEDGRYTCRCVPVGEVTATPVTGGLEIRFEAEFTYLIVKREDASFVSSVKPGDEEACGGERPSVVIRMVGEGERLWDIAKCCRSTMADIQLANAMECAEAPCGTLLLIPKCR